MRSLGRVRFSILGAGFLGTALAQRLVGSAEGVSLIGRNASLLASGMPGVRCVNANLEEAAPNSDIYDADVVFWTAGVAGVGSAERNPFEDLAANMAPFLHTLQNIGSRHVKPRVVFPSSQLVYPGGRTAASERTKPSPRNVHGMHRVLAEMYLAHFGRLDHIPWSILRIASVYGPGYGAAPSHGFINLWVDQALRERKIRVFGAGQQLRDAVYVDDALDAMVMAATSDLAPSRTFNVGSGQPQRVLDIARLVSASCPFEVDVVQEPWPADAERGEPEDIEMAVGLAARLLRWRSKVSLQDGIALTVHSREVTRPVIPSGRQTHIMRPVSRTKEPAL